LARTTAKPKTPLARRLCEARLALGFKERKLFAHYLGLLPETLGNYETGSNEPRASVLLLYHTQYNIALDWLLTGKGDMFDNKNRDYKTAAYDDIDKTALQKAVTAVEAGLGGSYVPPGKKAELIELACAVLKDSKAESLRKLISLLAALPKP